MQTRTQKISKIKNTINKKSGAPTGIIGWRNSETLTLTEETVEVAVEAGLRPTALARRPSPAGASEEAESSYRGGVYLFEFNGRAASLLHSYAGHKRTSTLEKNKSLAAEGAESPRGAGETIGGQFEELG